MKLSISLFALALGISVASAACSGDDGAISVSSTSSPLTDKGGVALFTVELTDARSDGYATDKYRVHVTPPDGKAEVDVVCTVTDVNTNQKLDKGDKLNCSEGTANTFDTSIAGKDSAVEMFATVDAKEVSVGSATWTAPK